MSYNTFGKLFRYTTWGESHGPAIGCTVDGVPPRIPLCEADIQMYLDQRKPGTSKYTTQRREADAVKILSGVFEGQTTGTPIQLMIENTDQRSKDYGDIAKQFRPGHADMSYIAKYGIRDYRGGGRSSARETASRVAAGAIARKILNDTMNDTRGNTRGNTISVRASMVQMGRTKINTDRFSWDTVSQNPFFCGDPVTADIWASELDAIRKNGSSIGAVIEVVAEGVPAGWGAPIYSKLDTDIAAAMMSINAVKGVEIGAGMNAAILTGEENADQMAPGPNGKPVFQSNNAGGILGGISSGQPIVARFAVKPTSSILTPRRSVNEAGEAVNIITKGRHDPCVGIRAVPVGEAMMAAVLADHMMMHRAQCG